MSQNTICHLLAASLAALLLATASCGDSSNDAATPVSDGGYPLEDLCIFDPSGREICGQDGAGWCKTYVAERDKVRVDENDVDATEIGCEAYEG